MKRNCLPNSSSMTIHINSDNYPNLKEQIIQSEEILMIVDSGHDM